MRPAARRWIAAALIGAAAFFLWWTPPEESTAIPHCPLLSLTGHYCPGCGSLRALHGILHGDLARAWNMNPLTVLLLPVLAALMMDDLLPGSHLAAQRIQPVFIWMLLGTFVLFGILRNLPFEPFAGLAPH